jgi:S-adenosylmethionine-diacylgycerolhomoserine-N-methlytransferase
VETAKKRVRARGWDSFVDVVLGDACDFECPGLPATGTADVVTFSYALTMIPDWRAAIRNAFRMLKPVSFELSEIRDSRASKDHIHL